MDGPCVIRRGRPRRGSPWRGGSRRGGAARIPPPAALALALVATLGGAIGCFRGDSGRDGSEDQRTGSGSDPASAERPELGLGRSLSYDYDPPAPGSYRLPVIQEAGDGAVLSADGRSLKLRDLLAGRITVLSFIYTRCADPSACPYATGVLHDVHRISGKDAAIAENLRLITFSFDPEHDTPRVMGEYGSALRRAAGSEWLFLTTRDAGDLAPILHAYGQRVDRKKDPGDPLGPWSHVLRVHLIDRRGMVRNIYSTGLLDPRLVVTDVRTLLLEEGTAAEPNR